MNTRHTLDSSNDRLPLYPLRVLRLKAGESTFIRVLSKFYRGLRTHYVKKRSLYCPQVDCPECGRHVPIVFKGYAACERYIETAEHWQATVLELTESLEQDMRGVFARGQVWEISRAAKLKDSQPPYAGRLHETLNAEQLPDTFDYLPCLLILYQVQSLDLSYANPQPPRMFLQPSKGAPPSGMAATSDKPLTPEQRKAIAEAGGLRGMAERHGRGRNGSTAKYY